MPATLPQLNRALLGTLMSTETANIVADRIEELEAALSAQIEGHKVTAKEASEAATLRASLNALHSSANRVAELFSAQYLRANADGGRVAHAMKQMNEALASASSKFGR